jgi:N-acetyl-1-D-myo-inositol-2-amino-2-deoxy-alpha-D-glucopyranoside deacetylase
MSIPFTLLAVYAHPDDEAFGAAGTLATITDRGGHVTLVCATRGEVGQISDPALSTADNLGNVREGELRAAMAHVGVVDIRFLGFRDSGMAGTPENDDPRAFVRASAADVERTLLQVLREVRPEVVLTFGPDGIYGHPDHLMISRIATAAFETFASESSQQRALYYNAVPKSRIQEMAKRPNGPFQNVSPDALAAYGTDDELITTVIDVSGQFERKVAAIRAHRTQITADSPWAGTSLDDVREFARFERFRLVERVNSDSGRDPLLEFTAPARQPA